MKQLFFYVRIEPSPKQTGNCPTRATRHGPILFSHSTITGLSVLSFNRFIPFTVGVHHEKKSIHRQPDCRDRPLSGNPAGKRHTEMAGPSRLDNDFRQ